MLIQETESHIQEEQILPWSRNCGPALYPCRSVCCVTRVCSSNRLHVFCGLLRHHCIPRECSGAFSGSNGIRGWGYKPSGSCIARKRALSAFPAKLWCILSSQFCPLSLFFVNRDNENHGQDLKMHPG